MLFSEEPMLQSMTELLKDCILSVLEKKIKDICSSALEFAICFRKGINERGWTPDLTDLMEVESRRFSDLYKYNDQANTKFDESAIESKIYDINLDKKYTKKFYNGNTTAKTEVSNSGSKIFNTIQGNYTANKNDTRILVIRIDNNGDHENNDVK